MDINTTMGERYSKHDIIMNPYCWQLKTLINIPMNASPESATISRDWREIDIPASRTAEGRHNRMDITD